MSKSESKPPPPGIYVPAVLFFKEDEELDEEAIKMHVLRLAQVLKFEICTRATNHRLKQPIYVL
jgi:4-hydroxy-2-oxoglutarate aldolase